MTQDTASQSNRRIERRHRPKGLTRATCRKGTLDLGANIIVSILDVAETGARLVVREQLQPNQEVAVTLESHNHARPLRAVGQVAWCLQMVDSHFCVGIKFNKRLPYIDVAKLA